MIQFEINDGIKTINGKSLDLIIQTIDLSHLDLELFKKTFNKINSQQDLIEAMKSIKKDNTPTEILLYIKYLTSLSLADATEILHEII
ncbi:MAG: hypothetical protein V4604_11715 [Bacteroidota bacterium]